MISVRDLSVSFGNKKVLNSINLDVKKGATFSILGKNGSGKSVLLKAMAGLISGYSGTIMIAEKDIHEIYDVEAFHRPKDDAFSISYVFQKGGLFDSMNVFENVAFPLRREGKSNEETGEKASAALKEVGLSGSEKKMPSELSGGMQKRAGIARAICTAPDIILYDDPTAGLDPVLTDSITDLMIRIKNDYKSTSIVVTHDLKVVKKIADETALLYNGSIVFSGSAERFFLKDDPYTTQFIEANLDGPIDPY
jgi:phospholipid/cholesterol/gamma-HCH transport system ATP-binding protein